MHIAIDGLDGAGKTTTAKYLAEKLGYIFLENPIYELVGRAGVNCFLEKLEQINGDLHTDICAMFYGTGNLYLNHFKQEKNVVTDRHLCSTYLWNFNGNNLPFFDFLVETCGKPNLTVILYAEGLERKRRIMNRVVTDPDLNEDIFSDEKYKMALEFVKRYNMNYLWLDNTYINVQQSVEIIKKCAVNLCTKYDEGNILK